MAKPDKSPAPSTARHSKTGPQVSIFNHQIWLGGVIATQAEVDDLVAIIEALRLQLPAPATEDSDAD